MDPYGKYVIKLFVSSPGKSAISVLAGSSKFKLLQMYSQKITMLVRSFSVNICRKFFVYYDFKVSHQHSQS